MAELALAGRQTTTDLAQRLSLAQLTEQHGQELSPAGEPAGVTLGLVLLDGLLKLQSRKQLENLGENAAYSTQSGFLLGFD